MSERQLKEEIKTYVKSSGTNMNRECYPSIFIIRLRRSNSDAPGNSGSPKNNSATMHPKDHISMAVVYLDEGLSSTCNSMSPGQICIKRIGIITLSTASTSRVLVHRP